ncbi:hypothetical protein QIS99_06955 [Streptomyces sp. B-S-A8]|uniref:Uncharacterized protein n=1 Tax=Streptomyces solicavernae TaxID=3043614 RepID=A0ABT6RQD1_9ACTN|nr:hypothetical protein [Streptomyces sp. B-S-A8]MDI3385958.1 hypothetical protein [Streptomyces sp. B-S-A8]
MPTPREPDSEESGVPAAGALLFCRAAPADIRPAAGLLRTRLHLAPAGPEWSVLVPDGAPWVRAGEPVDRVLAGWATALAVGAPWPVLALWWDGDRSGYLLAAGFRRGVGYVWLADGTPVGEDEAMRTFAARLGLDPVLDVQSLEPLTRSDPAADADDRLRVLLAVLARAGLTVPRGLTPGASADGLRSAARALPDAETVEWPGLREAVRAELAPEGGSLTARALAAAHLAAGLPLTLWGLRRHSAGWTAAGVLLLVHGALGLVREIRRPLD